MQYQSDTTNVDPRHLRGFFTEWPKPPSSDTVLDVLRASSHVVLAREGADEPLVGFVTALSDGVVAAYITFLEVRGEYRGRGIGTELVTRVLGRLEHLYMVDVTCDNDVLPFYERLGFTPATAAMIRRHGSLAAARRGYLH